MDQNFSCGHMYVCGSIQFLSKGLETSLRLLNNFLSVCNFHVFHLLISVQWYLKMLKERMHEKGVWDSCETDPSFWLDGSRDDDLGDSGQCGSGAMESHVPFLELPCLPETELFTHTDYCLEAAQASWSSSMGVILLGISGSSPVGREVVALV